MSEHVVIEKTPGLLQIILNRPEKKNALSNAMYEQICAGLQQATDDPRVRAVLVRSRSGDFTSGNDLADFAAVNRGGQELTELGVVRLLRMVVMFDKPLVAAVKGLAVGIGTTLLLHCDAVFAGRSSQFHVPFVKLGLVPEFASSDLLPRMAGRVRASHYLLSGEPFGIDAAREMGIISRACEDEEVDQQALAYCQQLAALPPATVRSIKRLISPPAQQQRLLETIARESEVFAACLKSAEHREALTAFFEKRPADFSVFE